MKTKEMIDKHNKRLLERMRDPNDRLTNEMSIQSYWFPPRPIIKKNKDDIKKLYKL